MIPVLQMTMAKVQSGHLPQISRWSMADSGLKSGSLTPELSLLISGS